MRQRLEIIGITSDSLDSIVDHAASELATAANNGGLKEQLDFLTKAGYTDERIWATILLEHLVLGMAVDVLDPKHSDSPHSSSFSGTVSDILDDRIRVRDMEDNYFDIEFDEIENFHPFD